MSDQPEQPQGTPMDRKLDQAVKPTSPKQEKYSNSALGKLPLADKPETLSDKDEVKKNSWSIMEMERALSGNLLKPSSLKLDQFAQAQNRKSDFRLRNTAKQLGLALERDQLAGTTSPTQTKLKPFEVQSQTMRMVSANAALGTYQFQKTMVLPYMRKSLALGYQKVALLKDVVGGISSLEKSVVAKLEAIKINTSSAAPRQKSYFRRLMDDVSFLNMRRISGNISNWTMSGYDSLYRKYVAPKTKALHQRMSSARPQDGVNGVRRALTGKLNGWRRSTRDVATTLRERGGRLNKVAAGTVGISSKLLGTAAGTGRKFRFGEQSNRSLTELLKGPTEDLAKFNPFSATGPMQLDLENEPNRAGIITQQPTPSIAEAIKDTTPNSLVQAFGQWRQEYRSDTDKIIGHLGDISGKMEGQSPVIRNAKPAPVSPTITIPSSNRPKAPTSVDDIVAAAGPASGPKTLSDQLSGPVEPKIISDALPKAPSVSGRRTTIGDKLKAARVRQQGALDNVASPFKHLLAPLYHRTITESAPVPALPVPVPAASGLGDTKLNRSFFTTMFDKLGLKITEVTKSVDEGNTERSKFEKVQTKWKELADKLRPKAIRKNSYEDIQAQKKAKGKGLLGRTADRLGRAAKTTGQHLLSGNLIGAAGSMFGDLFDWAKDEIGEVIGDKLGEATGDLWDKGKRRARVGGRRLRRSLRRRGILGRAAGAIGGGVSDGGAPTRNTLGRRMLSMAGRGARSGARAGGGLLARGAGAVGKAGLYLGKAALPAVATGIAADYASDWFKDNTTGGVQRLGTTAASMAQWGATGATVGSIVPGLGTATGALVGGAIGAFVTNTDLVSEGLSKLGNAAKSSGSFLWTSLFGKDASLDAWGRVKSQEQPSLLRNLGSSIFGQKAVYAKSGDIVRPGKTGLIPYLYQGFDKFFFGTKDEQKQYKPGSSILAQMGSGLADTLSDFKNSLMALPAQISSTLKGLYEGAKDVGGSLLNKASGAVESVTNYIKGKGKPVPDGGAVVSQLFPSARITSTYRSPNHSLSKANPRSWHTKSHAAVDVAPIKGMTFSQYVQRIKDAGYTIIEAKNEVGAGRAKWATGDHWHVVIGQGDGEDGNPTVGPAMGGKGPVDTRWNEALTGDRTVRGSPLGVGQKGGWEGYTFSDGTGLTTPGYNAGKGNLTGMGAGVPKSAKSLFTAAVNYLSQKKGWSRIAAMGIAANLFGESGLRTDAVGDSGKAIGIAQWHPNRQKDIESKFGKSLREMNLYEQLDAVDWELKDGKHVTSDKSIQNGSTPIVQAMNNSPNMEHVVQQMVYRYERPSNKAQETSRRINEAYGLVGSMGSDTVKPKSKPVQQADASKATTTATKAVTPKTATKTTPVKQVSNDTKVPSMVTDTDGYKYLADAMNTLSKTMVDAKGTTNTVNSLTTNNPTIIAANTSKSSSVSLAKERKRTGA